MQQTRVTVRPILYRYPGLATRSNSGETRLGVGSDEEKYPTVGENVEWWVSILIMVVTE
jgi:hypothetical protein